MRALVSAVVILLSSTYVIAGSILVYSHVHYPVYAAPYMVKTDMWGASIGPATQAGPVQIISAQDKVPFQRPVFSFMNNRELVFSPKLQELTPTLTASQYKRSAHVAIGWSDGLTFHIAEHEKVLKGYGAIEWRIIEPIVQAADRVSNAMIQELRERYSNHPYGNQDAVVRLGSSISLKEKEATKKRITHAQQALEKIMGSQIPQYKVPRVALCLSGGGMRAAMCSYGLFCGLEQTGLLDTITYAAALSGSTWFLSDWLTFGKPMSTYKEHFMKALGKTHVFLPDVLASQLWSKYVFAQDSSIVDLYGIYLANTFFSQIKSAMGRQNLFLSSLSSNLIDGIFPFPLFTAVEASSKNNWITCTPYEVSSETLGFSVPTWSFGRKFVNGVSVDYAPEQTLGFFMGMWGSALSGSLQDMLDTQARQLDPLLYNTLGSIMETTGFADIRLAGININNPLYGITESSYRFRNLQKLTIMDAGYSCNLPLPPLFHKERAIDVIIILDVSEGVHADAGELKKAEEMIRQEGLDFPSIDYTTITKKPVNIFSDPLNSSCPTIVYIVPVRDDVFDPSFDPAQEFSTIYPSSRFVYTKENIEKLSGLASSLIKTHYQELLGAITHKINKE